MPAREEMPRYRIKLWSGPDALLRTEYIECRCSNDAMVAGYDLMVRYGAWDFTVDRVR